MGYLSGFHEYLKAQKAVSVFDVAVDSPERWLLHRVPKQIQRVEVVENRVYDVVLRESDAEAAVVPKHQVTLVYPEVIAGAVGKRMKRDVRVERRENGPIVSVGLRHHVKNKSLYPLMKGRVVLLWTLLGGEVLKGIVAGFGHYEVTLQMKGGIPVTLLRHGVWDVRDKRGRCYLKSFQQTRRDWENSPFFVEK